MIPAQTIQIPSNPAVMSIRLYRFIAAGGCPRILKMEHLHAVPLSYGQFSYYEIHLVSRKHSNSTTALFDCILTTERPITVARAFIGGADHVTSLTRCL